MTDAATCRAATGEYPIQLVVHVPGSRRSRAACVMKTRVQCYVAHASDAWIWIDPSAVRVVGLRYSSPELFRGISPTPTRCFVRLSGNVAVSVLTIPH